MAADATLAHLWRNGVERLVFALPLYLVQDACLRGDDELLLVALHTIVQDDSRRTHHVGHRQHRSLTLGVSQYDGLGMFFFQLADSLHREALVHMAAAVPEQHVAPRHRIDIAS